MEKDAGLSYCELNCYNKGRVEEDGRIIVL